MADNAFKRVNWTTGMLLTTEHFRRSDAYSIEIFEWLLRYTATPAGLVGGGPRLSRGERGLEAHDPQLDVYDDGETVRLSVMQARGVTANGGLVETGPPRAVSREVPKSELVGQNELVVYLVRTGRDSEDPESVGSDEANPLQSAWVQDDLRLELGVRADELGEALAVGRIRRMAETQSFERDAMFIPACATMLAHSALFAGWRRIQDELRLLAGGFGELHRLVAQYVDQLARRGLDTRFDQSVSAFIERAVLALDAAVYDTMDPGASPTAVFQRIDRAGRQIALALDLSPSTREYLSMLSNAEGGYNTLLEEERGALSADRERVMRADLRLELTRAEQAVARVRSLLHALEGRYLDYRVNGAVDALRFLIDRGGEQFYTVVSAPGHSQRDGDLLTFAFPQLNLTGRHEYRLLILADPGGVSKWEVGDELRPSVRINASAGGGRPISPTLVCEVPGQRNFAMNFDTPADVATISSVQLTISPAHKVRGAILYQRRRGLVPETVGSSAAPTSHEPVRAEPPRPEPLRQEPPRNEPPRGGWTPPAEPPVPPESGTRPRVVIRPKNTN